MKFALFAIAFIASSASISAFAQTSAPAQFDNGTSQTASNNAVAPMSQWAAPTEQKTRAQVYQELVQAKQDGQMAYLNSTVYEHR